MAILRLIFALVRLPLFALTALAVFWAFRQSGLDSTVLMLEFHRLSEFPELAALPLLSAAGLILARDPVVARVVRHSGGSRTFTALGCALVAPGMGLLVFATAGAILAPATAPGHPEFLRAALPVAGAVLAAASTMKLMDQSLNPGPVWRDWRDGIGRFWPAIAMASLFYGGWLNPVAVAALVLIWVLAVRLVRGDRTPWIHVARLFGAAAVRTMPAVLILGLSIAWASLWQHRRVLPLQTLDGSLSGGLAQTAIWLLCAAAAALLAIVVPNRLAVMALLAPPAILLAQASGLGLLVQGLGLAGSIALGAQLRERSSSPPRH